MLTAKDLRPNIIQISWCSQLNILPLKFDSNTGKFSIVKSPWRRFFAWLQFLFFVAQVANANYTLLQSLLFNEYFVIRHFTFHLTFACASVVAGLWHFMYWIRRPNESARLFSFSFSILETNVDTRESCWSHSPLSKEGSSSVPDEISDSEDEQLELCDGHNAQQRTKIDWLTLFLPIQAALTLIFAFLIYLHEPSIMMLHFYGTFDASWCGYLLICLKSGFFLCYVICSLSPVISMHLLFFENTMEKLEKILEL